MPVIRGFLLALALTGCTCAPGPVTSAPRSAPAELSDPAPPADPGPVSGGLAYAITADLPPLTPAITLTVERGAIRASNRVLVQSWPRDERRRVEEQLGGSAIVEAAVPGADPRSMRIAPIAEALTRMAQIERTRQGGDAIATAYVIRADAEVPWQQVLQAVFTAAGIGLSEPRFALAGPSGEVQLTLPLERAREPERTMPLSVRVAPSRSVTLSIGARAIAAGCTSFAPTPVETVPARDRAMDRPALARCLDSVPSLRAAIGTPRLGVAGTIPFGEVAPLLELLRARYRSIELTL